MMSSKFFLISFFLVVVGIVGGLGFGAIVRHREESTPFVAAMVSAVRWETPTPTSSLHLFKNQYVDVERSAKYYTVGTFVSGVYKGGSVVVVTSSVDGPGPGGDSVYHVVSQSGKITLLARYSEHLYDGDSFDRTQFSLDDGPVLPELIFPEKISYHEHPLSLEENNFSTPFFDQRYAVSDLALAFTDPQLGNVYLDVPNGKDVKKNGFYVKAPDGLLRTYSLDIPFYDKNHHVPQLTWNDGVVNVDEYANTDIGGCGSRNYASVVSGLSMDDLRVVGTARTGESVYEIKDAHSSILQKIYENDYHPYDSPKVSYDEFVHSRPAFFWFDVFGRLIKFQKLAFVPVAECGKPVIYLYPEQATVVSVTIAPQGGLTKTEPNYGSGWSVLANHDGQLIDLHTGNAYPYLFWEGRGGVYATPEKGFVVAAQDVHDFLAEKLAKLGLNQRERADFMDFWEPRMTGAPYFFVTFLGNRAMDAIAPLTIIPKPDSIIRLLMDFSPLQSPVAVQGYEIQTPTRNGFTVVEWGGVLR